MLSKKEEHVLLSFHKAPDFWKAVSFSLLPFPEFISLADNLFKRGFLKVEGKKVFLTDKAYKLLSKQLVEVSSNKIEEVYKWFLEVAKDRPEPYDLLYDQGNITCQAVKERVRFMLENLDLQGRRIAVLGDDDLISLFIARLGVADKVTVFEIDERFCKFISQVSKKHNLKVEVVRHDLAKSLPKKYLGKYDVFICDPSETLSSFKMFIFRGLSLLKKGWGQSGYFGVTTLESSLKKWRSFQRMILNLHKVAIFSIIPHFSFYDTWSDFEKGFSRYKKFFVNWGPKRPWYVSHFWRIITLEDFEPKEYADFGKVKYKDKERFSA